MLEYMKERLTERARYRKLRRQRLRYRAPRFNNRKVEEEWIAPSIAHKIESHVKVIDMVKKILPVSDVIIEVANFDIQKIKNPDIQGKQYQEGEQLGFWNTREYIFHRDGHKCQNPNCTNKDEHPVLQVHHIIYGSNGGTDNPSNLITHVTHE